MKHVVCVTVTLLLAACRESIPAAKPIANTKPIETPVVAASSDVGARFSTIAIGTLSSDSIQLGAAGRQPLTLVNMWATWCKPCKAEFPDLQAIHEKYGPRGLRVIAVSPDQREAAVRAFLLTTNATFIIGRDTEERVTSFLRDSSLPQNVLIAPDGRILYKAFGLQRPMDPALTAAIESALGGT